MSKRLLAIWKTNTDRGYKFGEVERILDDGRVKLIQSVFPLMIIKLDKIVEYDEKLIETLNKSYNLFCKKEKELCDTYKEEIYKFIDKLNEAKEERYLAIWKYDYDIKYLCGEIEEFKEDGWVTIKGYNGYKFKPLKVIPYDEKYEEKLKELTEKYRISRNELRNNCNKEFEDFVGGINLDV